LHALTGYRSRPAQLKVLHKRGFVRAFINQAGVLVLERAHYEAVCQGMARSEPKRPQVVVPARLRVAAG